MFGSRGGADQGAGPERAQPHRDLRRDGVDLPGRPPVGVPRLHADGHPRRYDADPHVLRRLRPVDGLRGVPALPHQGRARPHARQRQIGRPGSRADRAHRHRRRRAHQRRVPRVRHVGGRLHQAVRHRAHARRAHRRVRHPRHPRARLHAPRRRGQLVGTGTDAALLRAVRHLRDASPRALWQGTSTSGNRPSRSAPGDSRTPVPHAGVGGAIAPRRGEGELLRERDPPRRRAPAHRDRRRGRGLDPRHRRRRRGDGAVHLPPLPGQGDPALRGVRPPVRDVRRGARSRRRDDGRPPRGARATVRGVRTLRTRATRGVPHHVHGSVHAGQPAHRHGGEGGDDRVQPSRGCGTTGRRRRRVAQRRRSGRGGDLPVERRARHHVAAHLPRRVPVGRSRHAACAGSRGSISTGSARRRRPSGSVSRWCSIDST